jgi:hypothetical protein
MEPLGTRCGLLRQQPVAVDDGTGNVDQFAVRDACLVRSISNAEASSTEWRSIRMPLALGDRAAPERALQIVSVSESNTSMPA